MRIPPVKVSQSVFAPNGANNSLNDAFERLLEQVQNGGSQGLEQVGQLASMAHVRMLSALMDAFGDDDASDSSASFMNAWGGLNFVKPLMPAGEELPTAAVQDVDALIAKAAETHGVDRDLIRAVIKAESDFNPQATSPKGAMGLMQLMPATARGLGVANAYDPEQNIMGGTRFLRSLLNRFGGDVERALAAYNWGPGNVERYPDRLPLETRNYIARITADLHKRQS